MKFKNSKIVIIGMIFFAFLFIPFPIETFTYSEQPNFSGTYVPSGLIAMWAGPLDEIPSGWRLCDGNQFTPNTTDRFIYNTDGIENAGATGGNDNHSHSYTQVPYHDHGVSGVTDCSHSHNYVMQTGSVNLNNAVEDRAAMGTSSGHTGYDSATHSHTTTSTGLATCYTSDVGNILPPYYKLAFIKKIDTNPSIPSGIIMIWGGLTEDIPQGWKICNGSFNTPDLEGHFILGVSIDEDPGETGGNMTHSHTYTDIPIHSHSLAAASASHRHSVSASYNEVDAFPWQSYARIHSTYTAYTDVPHTHSMNPVGQALCTTEEENHEPPYTIVSFIMNTQETYGIPTGCSCFWGGIVANIPVGWSQCDGNDETMDLRSKFLKANSLAEPVGTTGGAMTHTHMYTEVPYHNHVVNSDNMHHRHSVYEYWESDLTSLPMTQTTAVRTSSRSTTSSGTSSAPHSHDILPAGIAEPHTNPASNLPPYIELTIINQTSLLTSIAWVSPEDASVILFPRAPTVQFDFEYEWLGLGNDITLSFTNGTDNHDAGSVLGLDHVFIPYFSGLVTATFHLFSDETELTIATRSFTFVNNRAPIVGVVQPNGGETLKGEYEIQWTGSDPDGDQLYYKIEYNSDNTGWVIITSDLTSTTYNWDTETVSDSNSVKIRVTARDNFGGESSDESDSIFAIDNEAANGGNGDQKIPGYSVVAIFSILMITTLFLRRKLKNK